jgi:hypothetical protein
MATTQQTEQASPEEIACWRCGGPMTSHPTSDGAVVSCSGCDQELGSVDTLEELADGDGPLACLANSILDRLEESNDW